MNKNQINRKEMHDAVIDYLDATPEKWTPIPKIGESKNELDDVNEQIEAAQEAQQGAKVYIGKTKKQVKKTVAQKADIVNDLVEVYGAVIGDTALELRMAKSYSDLKNLRNVDFNVAVKEVITETENHKEVLLAEYGLTEEQITDLKTDVNTFLTMQGLPRAYQIATTQATKDLETLFARAEKIFTDKLDKLMKIFKRRDANFYNGYLAARVVVDD